MTGRAQNVLEQALQLDPVERAELIEALFHSFAPARDQRVDSLWAEEAESRIDAHDAGQLPADSADDVFTRIGRR